MSVPTLADLTRECVKCGVVKAIVDFYVRNPRTGTRFRTCKSCQLEQSSARRRAEKSGWSKEQFDQAFKDQQGRCAICNKERVLVGDHSASTNTTRQLLCHGCNLAIGNFHDDPELCISAAEYLRRWNSE